LVDGRQTVRLTVDPLVDGRQTVRLTPGSCGGSIGRVARMGGQERGAAIVAYRKEVY
jgi:hypothetical protein